MKPLRPPAVAGAFYPEDASVLQRDIDDFLANAPPPDIKGEIKALIAPHAGYIYSGQVAAFAYKALEGRSYSAIIVLAPSHYTSFSGASIYKGEGYQLPTGVVPIQQELSQRITEQSKLINFVPAAHAREHSLEVQLPFLQRVQPGFQLVPMLMGGQDWETCGRLARAIVQGTEGERVLLVASSDLSHYHSYAKAEELDKIVQDYVNNFDPEGLSKAVARGDCEACGAGPMITAMLAARQLGADSARVLCYANSGDVSGSSARVVGYLAAALYSGSSEQVEEVDTGLSAGDKQLLHQIARTAIESKLRGETLPAHEITSPVLREKRGGFVTLKKQGRLRGCIGYIQAVKPLYQTVAEMALAAAFNDHRFSPLRADELPELELEISVLTPLEQIQDIEEIEVGRHGLYIRRGGMSGLLLPQVATEYNWDRLTFLQQTCLKAGLSPGDWQDEDTKIYTFSADIF